jgi:hypothetical protein
MRRPQPTAPDWADARSGDPGITLVELFGFLGETLIYSDELRRRRAARRRKLAVTALVLVVVWLARADRGE